MLQLLTTRRVMRGLLLGGLLVPSPRRATTHPQALLTLAAIMSAMGRPR